MGDEIKKKTKKQAYITILGRSTWALINTYYAVLDENKYRPDIVYIFAEDLYEKEVMKAIKGVEILSQSYGINPEIKYEIVPEAEFIEAGVKIGYILQDFKKRGFTVAIDTTPGRKTLVAGALISASKFGVDHVFYLAIKTLEDVSKPYKMIPSSLQKLKDFMEEVKHHIHEGEIKPEPIGEEGKWKEGNGIGTIDRG